MSVVRPKPSRRPPEYFCTLAEQLDRQWNSPDQASAGIRFDDDWDNLAAAHTWTISTGAIDASTALVAWTGEFAFLPCPSRPPGVVRSHPGDGGVAVESFRRRISSWASTWALFDGDLETALNIATSGLDDDDDRCAAFCLNSGGHRALRVGPNLEATAWVPVMRSRSRSNLSSPCRKHSGVRDRSRTTVGHPDAEGDVQAVLDSALPRRRESCVSPRYVCGLSSDSTSTMTWMAPSPTCARPSASQNLA